jgi:hypothetical protein
MFALLVTETFGHAQPPSHSLWGLVISGVVCMVVLAFVALACVGKEGLK